MSDVSAPRIYAFKRALLNTCVRFAAPYFEEENPLTIHTCMDSEEFLDASFKWLQQPFFAIPVEPAMELARKELMADLVTAYRRV